MGHFPKTPINSSMPALHPLCNVDLKHPSHPESLQALSTLLGGGAGRAVTKAVSYKQSNRLMQGIFHKYLTFGQDCSLVPISDSAEHASIF